MDYIEITKQNIIEENKMIGTYTRLIKTLPEGRLTAKHISGKNYYYYTLPGEKQQIYISVRNNELTEALQNRGYAEEALRRLKKNVQAQKRMLKQYRNWNSEDILKGLGKAYRMPMAVYNTHASEYDSAMQYKTEGLIHYTSSGIKVRSKSEAVITEKLEENNVKFQYEKPLYLYDANGEMQIRYPDFTIYTKDGRKVFWEHFGMMMNSGYRNAAYRKLELYYDNGIIPGSNLIITEDGKNGALDTAAISKIVRGLNG